MALISMIPVSNGSSFSYSKYANEVMAEKGDIQNKEVKDIETQK
jgi:hypothetical protein